MVVDAPFCRSVGFSPHPVFYLVMCLPVSPVGPVGPTLPVTPVGPVRPVGPAKDGHEVRFLTLAQLVEWRGPTTGGPPQVLNPGPWLAAYLCYPWTRVGLYQ